MDGLKDCGARGVGPAAYRLGDGEYRVGSQGIKLWSRFFIVAGSRGWVMVRVRRKVIDQICH